MESVLKMGKQLPAYKDGHCFKNSAHTWSKNQEVFWHKTDEGKTIMCSDQTCFENQGGKVNAPKQQSSSTTSSARVVTGSSRDKRKLAVQNFLEDVEPLITDLVSRRLPQANENEKMIAFEAMLKPCGFVYANS